MFALFRKNEEERKGFAGNVPALRRSAETALDRLEKRICDVYGNAGRARIALCEAGDIFCGPTETLFSTGDGLKHHTNNRVERPAEIAGKTAVRYLRSNAVTLEDRGTLYVFIDEQTAPEKASAYIKKMFKDQMLVELLNDDILMDIQVFNLKDESFDILKSTDASSLFSEKDTPLLQAVRETVCSIGIEACLVNGK